MAYRKVPPPGSDEGALRDFLEDLGSRKEFGQYYPAEDPPRNAPAIPGLRLHGAQLFLENIGDPRTPYKRLLGNWMVGLGKTIGLITVGQRFVELFRSMHGIAPRDRPTVYVIASPGIRNIIATEMLRFPEFGYVSAEEIEEIDRLRLYGTDRKQLGSYIGVLKRRITDRSRGGYHKFLGYKEFANRLFLLTRKGAAKQFDVKVLWEKTPEGQFLEKVDEAVSSGLLQINEKLLRGLKNGLLIVDEVQNIYNLRTKNNYGIAIQYVLDVLEGDAPRVLFLSATPLTGSAAEAVDLLNLLRPDLVEPLRKSDYFKGSGSAARLRPGAAAELGRLSTGFVSFALDTDGESYPARVFEGATLDGIPYLKFTEVEASDAQKQVWLGRGDVSTDTEDDESRVAASTSLYDMVYPGVDGPIPTLSTLADADPDWLAAQGMALGRVSGVLQVSGDFLRAGTLEEYSPKYAKILSDILRAIEHGDGKIMLYNHRVRSSGVILFGEILRMNGFVLRGESPRDSTICAYCGSTQSDPRHGGANSVHPFTPARFVAAHYYVDRAQMEEDIRAFNEPSNIDGGEIMVLIGSRIISEGYTIKAVRRQMICNMPTDISSLLQVLGRVRRKNSHEDLPPEKRDVTIQIYITTGLLADTPAGLTETERYLKKMGDYIEIQEVERSWRKWALDAGVIYGKLTSAYPQIKEGIATLDSLPYTPAVSRNDRPLRTTTFEAYGHGDREVVLLQEIIKTLFAARQVWTAADLWDVIRAGNVRGVYVDSAQLSYGNYLIALATLLKHTPQFYYASPYYIWSEHALGIQSHYRKQPPPRLTRMSLRKYVGEELENRNFRVRLAQLRRIFAEEGGGDTPPPPTEFTFLYFNEEFHYKLLQHLVEAEWGQSPVLPPELMRGLRDMYRRYRVLHLTSELTKQTRAELHSGPGSISGYTTKKSIRTYTADKSWIDLPRDALGRRNKVENKEVVGWVAPAGARQNVDAPLRFKLRPSIPQLKSKQVRDIRQLHRGKVCSTFDRDSLQNLACKLKALRRSEAESLPTLQLCDEIFITLLRLEEASIREAGKRYMYLFNEDPPSIALLKST